MSFENFNRRIRRRERLLWWVKFLCGFAATLTVIAMLWFIALTATAP